MDSQQLRLFKDWGPETEADRATGKQWIDRIKGNLSRMGDPRFMGTEQRRRMGAESSHMGMVEGNDRRQQMRAHLAEAHGFSDSDFGLFGDEPLSPHMLSGAHGQEHDYNPAVNHTHEE